MSLEKQQSLFDEVKWLDSIQAGEDRCGTYSFCSCCVKTAQYPCARAKKKQSCGAIRIAVVHTKR